MKLRFITARANMLEEVNDIYIKCRENLIKHDIFQWDDHYPNRGYFQDCMENKMLFVLLEEDKIVGHVVLNEWQTEEWQSIPWNGNNPLIIHSLMLNPRYQGKGIGAIMVQHMEEYALAKGYDSIRLDVFSGNPQALKLYKKHGYIEKGEVFFASKPIGYQKYLCMEKELR
ncbi:GNAT family N-acetyltransferase [Niallia sp. FSL R7-0648]|uniref:GNAT family N-acetyltransferase n=1 Tax=Niallia sp. FSL R7-0648 TaxID=2954521 RepID=UPI0030F55C34